MRMSGSKAGRAALGAGAAAGVKHMEHRFIVGETPREATGVLEDLWKHGVATSVDLLGEATITSAEADRYAARCREALDGLVAVYRKLPERPHLEEDSAGASRARTCRSRSRPSPRCCGPTRPSSASATPPCA